MFRRVHKQAQMRSLCARADAATDWGSTTHERWLTRTAREPAITFANPRLWESVPATCAVQPPSCHMRIDENGVFEGEPNISFVATAVSLQIPANVGCRVCCLRNPLNFCWPRQTGPVTLASNPMERSRHREKTELETEVATNQKRCRSREQQRTLAGHVTHASRRRSRGPHHRRAFVAMHFKTTYPHA